MALNQFMHGKLVAVVKRKGSFFQYMDALMKCNRDEYRKEAKWNSIVSLTDQTQSCTINYSHLIQKERYQIFILLREGFSNDILFSGCNEQHHQQ